MTEMLRKCFVSKSASETFYYDKWQRLAKRPEGTLSSILCVLQDMLVVVRNDVDVSEHEGICRLREKLPEYEDCFIACREKTSLDDVIEEVREFQYILESRKRQLNNGARDNARDNQRRTRTNRSGQSSSVSTPTPAPTSSAATVAATLVDVTTQGSDTRGPERRTCHRSFESRYLEFYFPGCTDDEHGGGRTMDRASANGPQYHAAAVRTYTTESMLYSEGDVLPEGIVTAGEKSLSLN